jgi:hypothetical protein
MKKIIPYFTMVLVMYLAGVGAICFHVFGPYRYPYEISTRTFWAYSVAPLTTKYNHPVLLLATSIILGLGTLGIVLLRKNGRNKTGYVVLCILSISWAIWVWIITGLYATGAC